MDGINVSQARAERLLPTHEIFIDPDTGLWVEVADSDDFNAIRLTGDVLETIPASAFPMPLSLPLASAIFGIPYRTLQGAAKDGRLTAWQSGTAWLTTRRATLGAIDSGKLKSHQ